MLQYFYIGVILLVAFSFWDYHQGHAQRIVSSLRQSNAQPSRIWKLVLANSLFVIVAWPVTVIFRGWVWARFGGLRKFLEYLG